MCKHCDKIKELHLDLQKYKLEKTSGKGPSLNEIKQLHENSEELTDELLKRCKDAGIPYYLIAALVLGVEEQAIRYTYNHLAKNQGNQKDSKTDLNGVLVC